MGDTGDIDEVVVIGAGLSGMTAAYELKRRGIQVRLLEKESDVGLPWRRRHPQLSLNTHRSVSHMPGLRYAAGTPAFPKRDMVADHLQDFARANKLQVEYGVTVTGLRKHGAFFHLDTSGGGIAARNVVIAVGRDGIPHIPSIAGRQHYRGQVLHAADLGHISQYAGKRVLVAGGGNSGFDLLNHLAKADAAECWISVRTGSAVLPKRLYGLALHRFSPVMARLPAKMADLAIKLAGRAAFGDLTKLGFPRSPHGAATRLANEHVAIPVDDGAIRAVREGRIKVVGEIAAFTETGTVLCAGGREIDPDVVIYATGYSSVLSHLLAGLPDGPDKGLLHHHQNYRSSLPGLWFVGMTPGLVSYFHNARMESAAIARAIKAAR